MLTIVPTTMPTIVPTIMLAMISPKNMQEIATGGRLPFARNSNCQRVDMKTPLAVFAGLLVAIAICGTLEARSPLVAPEPQVVHDENVLGPVDPNLHAACSKASSKNLIGGTAGANLVRAQDCDVNKTIKL